MPRKTLLLLVLSTALISCACTTRQSASPLPPVVAPCPKTPLPPELAQRPTPPEPLAPGYYQQHPE